MRSIIYLVFLFAVSGCKVGPAYKPPQVEIPENWKTESIEVEKFENVGCWWEIFHDPLLNELEEKAIFNNQDIRVAISRVKQEWAQAGVTKADLFPQISASPTLVDLRTLFKLQVPPNTPSIPPFRTHVKEYIYPLTYSYQFDFWRKNWDNYEAAYASAEAQEEALRNVLLTITTDLAENYFQLRSYDQQLVILDKAIQIRQDASTITLDRFQAGLTSYIDSVQAKTELYSSLANKEDIIRLRAQSENLIAVLIGTNASEFCLPPNPLLEEPPTIPAGLPSELLLRRPDIAEAERKMASMNASIGVAIASFFPTFQIFGAIGYASPDFKQLFKWISNLEFLQAQISQIIFDGGRLYNNYIISEEQYREAIAHYRGVILTAFREVEDALIAIQQREKQRSALSERVKFSHESVDLSDDRYLTGIITYLDVVIELRNDLEAQLDEQSVLADQYISTIQLIKALGGGFGVSSLCAR